MQNKISKLGLGTVQFGIPYGISNSTGKTTSSEVATIIKSASQNHIQYIDTAAAYGNAEEVLGKNSLENFRVVSKFMPSDSYKSISNQLEETLKNLRLSKIYGYMAHRPLSLVEDVSIWDKLKILKEKKLVHKIGYSLNQPEELKVLLDKNFFPDIVQVPYNYFDRRFEQDLIYLKKAGCEIHTRSAFLQGLFFVNPNQLSSFFNEVKPHLVEVKASTNNLAGSLLNYVLCKDFIHQVIIGVENNDQLLSNISSIANVEVLKDLDYKFSDNILMPSNWPKEILSA